MKKINKDHYILILQAVHNLFPEAYGLTIREELRSSAIGSCTLGAIHSDLNHLEKLGSLKSTLVSGSLKRGGRPKRLFMLTPQGLAELNNIKKS